MDTVPCIQCGVCCISGPCGLGKEDEETGLCKHLKFHDEGHTSCKLYDKAKYPNLFDSGCALRARPEIYEIIVELLEQGGRKIRGIGGQNVSLTYQQKVGGHV